MRSWEDEGLFGRPPQEDSRRHRAGHAQNPSCSPLRREPLLKVKRSSATPGAPLGESPSHPEKKSPGRPRKADEKARALPEESGRYVFGAARPRISNTSVPFEHDPPEGMSPSLTVEGATTSAVFSKLTWRAGPPGSHALRTGQVVVVMDDLSAHKGGRVRELIEGRGCELFCTCRPTRRASIGSKKPSPRSRASLEKSEARTREALLEALLEALGAAISAVTAKDARGFLEHCGYHGAVQLF